MLREHPDFVEVSQMTATFDAKFATAILLVSLWNNSPAGAEKPRKVALLPCYSGQVAVNQNVKTAADWFRLFEKVEDSAQLSKADRNSGNLLMMRALAGVTTEPEQMRAEQLLTKMIARYRNASQKISALPELSETKPLQLGYAEYYKSAADLCQLCMLMRSGDGGKYRRLTGEEVQVLMERKRIIDKLLMECRQAEGMTRVLQGVPAHRPADE